VSAKANFMEPSKFELDIAEAALIPDCCHQGRKSNESTSRDPVLRPSKSKVNHPLNNPVSFRPIGKTLPDAVWDTSAKE
jgi:hypothetical protein